ncbi:MAG: C1 family peptidase [Muribaculaceae bacterium]|nr:C1 family peptidase [Muribaculaceae bacterium]
MKKNIVASLIALTMAPLSVFSAEDTAKGIDADALKRISASYENNASDRAIRNALNSSDINKLAANADARRDLNTDFSHRVKSKGITNQKSSGRCWLFTGLNVLRSQMMAKNDLPELKLSQNYNFFYDQLEKSDLFLDAILETASKPMDDKTVEWLFKNPLSDGGQYTGISDNIMKYGVVPASAMPETYTSENTSRMRSLLSLKLREYGLELRNMYAAKAKSKDITARKEQMLGDVYRILALTLGVPPTEFEWTRKDTKGNVISRRKYTPKEFYDTYAGNNLKDDYVMLMNDPTREYYKLYEIEYDRHTSDGQNWTYVNLPVEDIKEMAIASIKDSTMMYFSCDVNKFIDRDRGILDIDNYDYASLLGTQFPMNKADRIRTFSSASSHAMTLCAVDIDADGKPVKWMVENSWGPGANDGHLIMTDRWFDEYMFRLVVNKKYATPKTLDILKQKPVKLPAWDPMFADKD